MGRLPPQPRVLVLLPLLDGVDAPRLHHLGPLAGPANAPAFDRLVGEDDHAMGVAVGARLVADGVLVPSDLAPAGERVEALPQALLGVEELAELVFVPFPHDQGIVRRGTGVGTAAAAVDVRLELQQAGGSGRLELLLELVHVGIQSVLSGVQQEAVVLRGVARVPADAHHGHGDAGGDAGGAEPGTVLGGALDLVDQHFGRELRVGGEHGVDLAPGVGVGHFGAGTDE
ncbi:hypothetical protein PG985_010471 [Apiospora marii]|uniref:Secreted protein n=1 Tax=Apiospora marii TaxID=335849 RepID=A0ABR1RZD0_9PEZI